MTILNGITLALSKGRIFEETLPLLAAAGITPTDNPETSRKLIIGTNRPDVRLVIVRATDTPTYVQYGAADIGVAGKDVLIVEDILDTGITLSNLVPMLKMRNPNSVKICTILDKPSRRKADIAPDYEGFAVPDEFVVGYGLDYDEKYRNLPYIGVLKPSVYEK